VFYEKNGYSGKNGVPVVYEQYALCKEFGWTPEQLDNQADVVISRFLQVMGIVNETK